MVQGSFCPGCGYQINNTPDRQDTAIPVKKKRFMTIGIVAAVVFIGVMVLSGGNGKSNSLVGKWEGVSVTFVNFGGTITNDLLPGEVYWEINTNGTGAVIEGKGTGRDDFIWRTDRDQLYMTYRSGETVPVSYSISGSTLTITMKEFQQRSNQTVVMTLSRIN